jgi:hypothetical protein
MSERPPDGDGARERILVIGDGPLIDVARLALADSGVNLLHLADPSDSDIRSAMRPDIEAVTVISRDDRLSFRHALVVDHLRPGVRLIVTIYKRDLGAELRRAARNVQVMSMADIAVQPWRRRAWTTRCSRSGVRTTGWWGFDAARTGWSRRRSLCTIATLASSCCGAQTRSCIPSS